MSKIKILISKLDQKRNVLYTMYFIDSEKVKEFISTKSVESSASCWDEIRFYE